MPICDQHCITPTLFLFSFLFALIFVVSPSSLITVYIICWQIDICSQITHPDFIFINSTAYLNSFQDIKVPPKCLIDISVSKIIPFHNCKRQFHPVQSWAQKNLGTVLVPLSHIPHFIHLQIFLFLFSIYIQDGTTSNYLIVNVLVQAIIIFFLKFSGAS